MPLPRLRQAVLVARELASAAEPLRSSLGLGQRGQVEDLSAARARAAALGIRTAWEIDLEDIAATHLHPADVGGTILSIDQATPVESWRWAGPAWEQRSAPGRLLGASLSVPDPEATAARWAQVLGAPLDGPATLALCDGQQRPTFERGDAGLAEIHVEGPDGRPHSLPKGTPWTSRP